MIDFVFWLMIYVFGNFLFFLSMVFGLFDVMLDFFFLDNLC